jgi:hypothetical protein
MTTTRDRGRPVGSRQRAIAVLLGLLGALTVATGLYLVVVRPPMLPEDLRFIGVSREQLPARMPLVATTLSIYKPRGLTKYGWRKQREGAPALD